MNKFLTISIWITTGVFVGGVVGGFLGFGAGVKEGNNKNFEYMQYKEEQLKQTSQSLDECVIGIGQAAHYIKGQEEEIELCAGNVVRLIEAIDQVGCPINVNFKEVE